MQWKLERSRRGTLHKSRTAVAVRSRDGLSLNIILVVSSVFLYLLGTWRRVVLSFKGVQTCDRPPLRLRSSS